MLNLFLNLPVSKIMSRFHSVLQQRPTERVCSRFYGGRAAYPGMNGHRDEEGLGAFRHWNQCPPGLLDHGGL